MNVKITSTKRGSFSTFVAFTADGVNHTALIYPQERAVDSKVFAFGKQGTPAQQRTRYARQSFCQLSLP